MKRYSVSLQNRDANAETDERRDAQANGLVNLPLGSLLESYYKEHLLLLFSEQILLLALLLHLGDVSQERLQRLFALRLVDGQGRECWHGGHLARLDRGGLEERRRKHILSCSGSDGRHG
jgi:hypothetical protein